jgi:Putative MetA-pathway of phenol degradation
MSRSLVLSMATSALALACAFGEAAAQDKSQYTLFNPTPKDKMRDFNTDRPTKSNVPYTVDAGHFQYEGDIFIYGFDNTTTPDTDITTFIFANPTFKLGLTNFMDFEVNFAAYNNIRSQTRSDGSSTVASGFGDVITRAKINLFGNEGGGLAMALIPYGKWPTAPQGVGNRYVEGGVIAPLAVPLPLGFTAIVMGELDYLKNPNDSGYHVNIPALLNINRQIVEGVTAYAEIYANWSTHRDVRDIYTLDFAVAWSPFANFQLDAGINIGLNAAATPYQIYMGISQRF